MGSIFPFIFIIFLAFQASYNEHVLTFNNLKGKKTCFFQSHDYGKQPNVRSEKALEPGKLGFKSQSVALLC